MTAHTEKYVGIEGYASSHPGFEGSIKEEIPDFLVEEIADPSITKDENGKYRYLKVRLNNWDTNKFLMRLSKELHISRKRVSYAGTKDKRGITVQYFCVNSVFSPEDIRIGGADILDFFRSDHFLKLGELVGNRFSVKISATDDRTREINAIEEEVLENGGFPNFFGVQRFGSIRMNTHRIGRLIVQGRYEEAVEAYIYDPEFDSEEFRKNFGETRDAAAALKEFPMHLNFERSILGKIRETGSFERAFEAFPRNLGMLFVHAYQSYLFNIILSERLKAKGNTLEIEPGDILYAVDRYFNPIDREEIKANPYNLEKLGRFVREDKLRVTVPLIGFESRLTSNFQGEIESRIMEKEGIDPSMFRIGGYPEFSSKGDRRIISAKPVDFTCHNGNTLSFSLGRGIYATSFLREFLKST